MVTNCTTGLSDAKAWHPYRSCCMTDMIWAVCWLSKVVFVVRQTDAHEAC